MEDETRERADAETRGRGDTEMRKRGDALTHSRNSSSYPPVPPSAHLAVAPSPNLPIPVSPCLRVSSSRRRPIAPSPRLRVFAALLLIVSMLALSGSSAFAQGRRSERKGSHSIALPESMSAEAHELVEQAINVICTERVKDPKGSHPIDEMQARPSLPAYSAEAVAGAQRSQRLLPIARKLVAASMEKLASEYKLQQTKSFKLNLQRAIGRVQKVRRVKPDMASRDNASVFLRRPQTITFGTIFLAGLPSDEAMISVLAHELVHIADGDGDGLRSLFRAVGNRASRLTGMRIHAQRAEELTCDLVGAMAARTFVSETPDYSPLPRRISRAVQHNCVEDDEGDEDHLSPRNTIRAVLALNPSLAHELVYGQMPARSIRRN